MGISVVVPVYRGGATLPDLVKRLLVALPGLADDYEIILVNDACPDDSWTVICELSASNPVVRGINLMRNVGQQSALLCGVRAARFNVTITMDDDLQHPPEEIAKLSIALTQEKDVVYGIPDQRRHGMSRNLAAAFSRVVFRLLIGIPDAQGGSSFRMFRTQLRDTFVQFYGPFVSLDFLLSWGTTRYAVVPVRHQQRATGRSGYSAGMLIVHALNILTDFSTLPLRLVSWVGFFMTIFGVFVLIWVLGRYMVLGYSFPGFPFLASTIAIFSGTQLFALGVFGEYLSRIYFRVMKRPAYTIRDTTRSISNGSMLR